MLICAETVRRIVGPGAVWPELTRQDIADEIFLEIEAGSSGKPNRAQDLEQSGADTFDFDSDPSINPTWLCRTVVQRVDKRLDLNQAIIEGLGSIVAQNAQTEPAPGAAEDDPQSQAARGTQNAPQGQGNEPQPQAGFLLFRLSCIRQLTRDSRRTDGDIDGNLPKAPFSIALCSVHISFV